MCDEYDGSRDTHHCVVMFSVSMLSSDCHVMLVCHHVWDDTAELGMILLLLGLMLFLVRYL